MLETAGKKDNCDAIWKALSDSTRREILDLLVAGPRTTGDICAQFAISRFGVMKHLTILENSGLIVIKREGRERWNYLNPVPIQQIYDRWISRYQSLWAKRLVQFKNFVEGDNES